MPESIEDTHMTETRYRLEAQVGYLLRQANQRHVAIFGGHVGDRLTTTQWSALVKLRDVAPCSQNQLGRETSMDVATIKGVVDRLVKRGLVATSPDLKDARRVMLSLTQAGHEAVGRNLGAAFAATEETLAPLTPGERMLFLEMLRKIC